MTDQLEFKRVLIKDLLKSKQFMQAGWQKTVYKVSIFSYLLYNCKTILYWGLKKLLPYIHIFLLTNGRNKLIMNVH